MDLNIIFIILCIGVGMIINQWRNKNILGKKNSTVTVPKGHNIFYFNPYALTIRKSDRTEIKHAPDLTLKEDRIKVSKNEVAIIALNFKNAIKRARKILILGGYEPEEAKEIIIKKTEICTGIH